MEYAGGGDECWLDLRWQLDRLVVRCRDRQRVCVQSCASVHVCMGIARPVSVLLSANLWVFAGCCHFDLLSSQTYLWVWGNKRIVVSAFVQFTD